MSNDGRPVTAPDGGGVHRVRSFSTLPPVDQIGEEANGGQGGHGVGQPPFMGFSTSRTDFAYNAGGTSTNLDSIDSGWMNGSQTPHGSAPNTNGQPRPSTAASSMSAHSSTSATQTPPVLDPAFSNHDSDINRCE